MNDENSDKTRHDITQNEQNDEFSDLYEEIIHDHYKKPKYRQVLDGKPFVENPSCGDRVRVSISLGPDGRIASAAFDGSGCSVSMSSADILSEDLIGKTPEEARKLIETFLEVLRGERDVDALDDFGDAVAFKGVARLPVRVKCAALAWRAALAELEKVDQVS
ncbi:MAG TPA: SUF system NifU family Fe-S cluster assembly protein [Spirochaetales bacterium]|nr:SUF system NifU family Fe-S cluster assembly protein [Spirochaetales bacterium]HPS14408.1 SUF system NifU family Fe-S cluster assembly protein [Spirochaetales bacterium]